MAFSPESASALRRIDDLFAKGGIGRQRRRSRDPEQSVESAPGPEVQRCPPIPMGGRDRIEVIRVPRWAAAGFGMEWLVHGFSTRIGGRTRVYRPDAKEGWDLNLGFTASDDPATVEVNRKLFLQAAGPGLSLVTLKQIHSSLIRRVQTSEMPRQNPRDDASAEPSSLPGDGMMTDEPGALLGILTADCIPILLTDRRNRAVAALHAGWRGTLARIVENGVGSMRLNFGSRPEDLVAAIGPGIGQCCYAVGAEVRHEFESQFAYAAELFREVYDSDPIREKYPMLFLSARAPGHSDLGPALHLDLAEANRRQLLGAGLRPTAIQAVGECTCCNRERYFSHRGEQGFTGRMLSVIGIRHGG